jgi:hypothetical protein
MKEINNILILIFITITIILLWKYTEFTNYNIEKFMSPGKAESISGNMEQSDEYCKEPLNPEYVGKYSKTCCEDTTPGCMCKLDAYKECKKTYETCFEEKGKKFKEIKAKKELNLKNLRQNIDEMKKQNANSQSKVILKQIKDKEEIANIMEEELDIEPDIPPGIKQQCQDDFGKCSTSNIKINKNNKKYNQNKFKILPMKRRASGSEKICELSLKNDDEIALCINYCDEMKDCHGGIYNKNNGACELYNKPLIDKQEGARNSDKFNINFTRISGSGSSSNSSNDSGKEGYKNINNNSRRKDIEKIIDKVEKKKKGYKTCKSTFNDNIKQLRETHKFTKLKLNTAIEPEYGTEVCRRHNISYDKCTDECLLNDNCDYLMYGSPIDSSGIDNTKYYSGGNKCVLYSGVPSLEGDSISLSKVDSGDGYSFYIKRLMSYDERVGLSD